MTKNRKNNSISAIILDDDELTLHALSSLLTSENINILSTHTKLNHALREIRKTTPDIVLVDVVMPQISGEDSVRRIKSDFPELPTIAITSLAEIHAINSMIKAGCCGYILKSCPPKKMAHHIKYAAMGYHSYSFTPTKLLENNLTDKSESAPTTYHSLPSNYVDILSLLVAGESNRAIAKRTGNSLSYVKRVIENCKRAYKVNNRVSLAVSLIRDISSPFNDL